VAHDDWLKQFLSAHGAVAGTVHLREGEVLNLAASVNIPPPVVQKTQVIPKGKGMAGLAWERDAPVATCNLQTDQTGDVRPGAKAVDAGAAIALPIHDAKGGLRGVVGLAFVEDRDFSPEELARFAQAAEALPQDA
jgi:L-methionine (R)-S-oxide reductase